MQFDLQQSVAAVPPGTNLAPPGGLLDSGVAEVTRAREGGSARDVYNARQEGSQASPRYPGERARRRMECGAARVSALSPGLRPRTILGKQERQMAIKTTTATTTREGRREKGRRTECRFARALRPPPSQPKRQPAI
jgi:hypothetical protein